MNEVGFSLFSMEYGAQQSTKLQSSSKSQALKPRSERCGRCGPRGARWGLELGISLEIGVCDL